MVFQRLPVSLRNSLMAVIFFLTSACNLAPDLPLPPSPTFTSLSTITPGLELKQTETPTLQAEVPTQNALPEQNSLTLSPNFLADSQVACFSYTNSAVRTGNFNFNPHVPDTTGFSCLDRNGWLVYPPEAFEAPLNAPSWVAGCPDGRIYLKMAVNIPGKIYAISKIYRMQGGSLTPIPDFDEPIRLFACGPGQEIWFSNFTSGGLSRYNGSTWVEYPPSDFLGSFSTRMQGTSTPYPGYPSAPDNYDDFLLSLVIAPDGSVWVATRISVATFDGSEWKVYQAGKDFVDDPDIFSMDVDLNGIVWVSNRGGLLMFDGSRWSDLNDISPNCLDSFAILKVDQKNRVWCATSYPAAIDMYDPHTQGWTSPISAEMIKAKTIEAMQFDQQGRLWFITDNGLDVYDGSTVIAYHMYSADLYANTADSMIIMGNGPQLPALEQKAPASLHGKLINPDPTLYEGKQVELCEKYPGSNFSGETPCASQLFHLLTTVTADGNFRIVNIPPGRYSLAIQNSSTSWSVLVQFEIPPGADIDLGELNYPLKQIAPDLLKPDI